jgi:PAS domain S-box-containing protein
MILALDARGTVTMVNRKGCEILGRPEKDIVGKCWFDHFLPERVREEVRTVFPKYLSEGGPENWENNVLAADGTERLIAWHNATLRNGNGKAVGTLSSGQDVTEHRRAEEALRASEKRFKDLVGNLSEVVVEADIEGNLTYASAQAEPLYGFRPEELVGKNISELIHPDDLGTALETLAKVAAGDPFFDFRFRTLHKDGRYVHSSATGRMVQEGESFRIVGLLQDVTKRMEAEEALQRSERLFRLMAENSRDLIFRIRLQPDMAADFVSPSARVLTGRAPDDFLKDPALAALLLPDAVREGREGPPRMRTNLGGPHNIPWRREDGSTAWLEVVCHPVLDAAGRLVAVEGVGRDVTERRQVKDALRESEEKFRNLAEQSPNMIFINQRGPIVYVNRRSEELLGYSREEMCAPDFDFFRLVAPESRQLVAENYGAHFSGRELSPFGLVVVAKSGRKLHAILSSRIINYAGEAAMLGMITDISELRRSEEALRISEEKYRELVENINDVIFSADVTGTITYISPAVERVLGIRPEDIAGKNIADFIVAEDLGRMQAAFAGVLAGRLAPSEFRVKNRTDVVRWVRTSSRPTLSDGKPSGLSGVLQDITERRLADDRLKDSLEEKVVLLKEIHHRVKNNLQIIYSLLNMQARQLPDAAGLAALRESQSRIRTMALIHERLYMSNNLSEVNLKDYLPLLARELYSTFGADPGRIRLELDVADVKLGVDSAIPCGLLLNELVSNALKHGFPGGRRGILRIEAGAAPDGKVRLVVRDTGVGLPKGFDIRAARTLGLQLVRTLADQLRGTLEVGRRGGTRFSITFDPAGTGDA